MAIVDPEADALMQAFERCVRDDVKCPPCLGYGVFRKWVGSELQTHTCKSCCGSGWLKKANT